MLASAQFVEIPDSSFRAYLKKNYPTCFNNSDLMDTTCSGIIKATSIFPYFSPTRTTNMNIEGVQYFDNLEEIYINGNCINWISSKLPPKLRVFRCELGYLKSLPQLPESMELLDIVGNEVTSLPELPTNLKQLWAHNNQITQLPKLPSGLKILDVISNNISNIPSLPDGLETFWVGKNSIKCLPELPYALTELIISENETPCLPNEGPDLKVYVLSGMVSANNIERFQKQVPQCSNTFDPNSCYFKVVTNLEKTDINLDVNLYPNPAKNKITLSVNNKTIFKLFNNLGDLVLQQSIEGIQDLNIDNLKAGLYLYSIGEKSGKLIVE